MTTRETLALKFPLHYVELLKSLIQEDCFT